MNITKQQRIEICNRILSEQIKDNPYGDYQYTTDPESTVDVTTIGNAKTYGTLLLIALGIGILGRFGYLVTKGAVADIAAAKGITKGNALRWLVTKGIRTGVKNGILKFTGMESAVEFFKKEAKGIETALKTSKNDEQMVKMTGLTKPQAREVIDAIGSVNWMEVKNTLENQARQSYYAGQLSLDDYLLQAGFLANPKTAAVGRTWMPIFKKAYTGQMKFAPMSGVVTPNTFSSWLNNNRAGLYNYYNGLFTTTPQQAVLLRQKNIILPAQQQVVNDWIQTATREIDNIISKTPISIDIVNLANQTGHFPSYKKWSAIQKITKRNSSLDQYRRQKFCYLSIKHGR
jgi:hypothetical protein